MIELKVKIAEGGRAIYEVVGIEEECTYDGLLDALGINPETVVVLSDGVPVPYDDVVEASDIAVIRVVSAG